MKLSKIEMDLMVETNCVRTITSSYGGRVLEKDEKNDNYYKLLDETAKLSQIRTSKWVNFWSIFYIVCISIGIALGIICEVYNQMNKHYVESTTNVKYNDMYNLTDTSKYINKY